MKNIFLITLLLISSVYAKPIVEMNLEVGMHIDGSHKYTKKRFTGNKTKVDTYNHNMIATAGNGIYKENGTVSYRTSGVVTGYLGLYSDDQANAFFKPIQDNFAECKNSSEKQSSSKNRKKQDCEASLMWLRQYESMRQSPLYKTLRKTDFQISFEENKKSNHVKISVQDHQNHNAENLPGNYVMKYSGDFITGNIKIGIPLPKNNWAIIVKRNKMTGMFSGATAQAVSEKGMVNSFNQDLDYNGYTQFLAWGKPESTIYHQVNYNRYSKGANVEGDFEIDFEYVDFSEYENKSLDSILNIVESNVESFRGIRNFSSLLSHIKPILYLHGKEELQKTIINSFSSKRILNFIDNLNNIAYSAEMNIYHWDLKAASSILAHELALRLLSEVAVFCRKIDIHLPYSKENVSVLGLNAASYFMDRARLRLKYNTFIHFQPLIDQIESYESRGMTYKWVRNDSLEFSKLKEAFELLAQTVSMRYSIYDDVYKELDFIFAQFGTLGAPGIDNRNLFEQISSMRNKDIEFYKFLVESLRLFQPDNDEKVSAKKLKQDLNSISKRHDDLFKILEERAKVGSLRSEGNSQNLRESVLSLVKHNVEIFTESYAYKSFEVFRSNYFDSKKVDPILSSIQECAR